MDHKHIDDLDLVERYLMGRLAGEEAAQFEEHFVDCPQCADRLETTKALIEGLRLVASDQAAEAHTDGPVEPRQYWRHPISRGSLALAAGILLVVGLAGAVIVSNQVRRSRADAALARIAAAEWERRYEEERQSSSKALSKPTDSERELSGPVSQPGGLENEHEQKPEVDDHSGPKGPQINLAIFVLKATRGGDPANGSPNELTLPRSPANFVISVQLEEEGSYKAYRMMISTVQNQLIWKGSGLKPDRYNSLTVEFNSTFFRQEDYLLTVEGVSEDGATSVVGKYSLRVLKTP